MYQNYFFLNRFMIEASTLIAGSKILEMFSQEKSKLVISLFKDDEEIFLEICVVPGNSFINIRKKYSRAKKNTINFFSNSIGDKINAILIAEDDRVIKFQCDKSDIYFAIRGKYTNIFYFSNGGIIEAFKTIDKESLAKTEIEFEGKIFINHFNKPELNIEYSGDYLEVIRKKYSFIGSEIIKEAKARASNPNLFPQILSEVLCDIETKKTAVFVDENSGEVSIGFETFKSFPATKIELFNDVIAAQNFFFSKEHFLSSKKEKLKLISRHLEKELNRLSSKINKLQGVIERGSKDEEYNKMGNLLLINLTSIKSGMNEIVVDDIYGSGGRIKIKLNLTLTPKKNVDYYFYKSKSEKTGFAKSQELLQKAKSDFNRLKKIERKVEETETINELESIMKELKIKEHTEKNEKEDLKSGNPSLREKFKQYIIDGKYHVFVGKDSQNNDLLTTRFAKQNDFWFHARSVSGSHVVLRVDNAKEPIPKNILKKAAALAAYHSKAKTSGMVPVAYTFKKYVIKKKDMPPGTVHLLREDVLIVKPEIPDGCEFVDNY